MSQAPEGWGICRLPCTPIRVPRRHRFSGMCDARPLFTCYGMPPRSNVEPAVVARTVLIITLPSLRGPELGLLLHESTTAVSLRGVDLTGLCSDSKDVTRPITRTPFLKRPSLSALGLAVGNQAATLVRSMPTHYMQRPHV